MRKQRDPIDLTANRLKAAGFITDQQIKVGQYIHTWTSILEN
jgi:hypothetical protein